MSIEGTWFASYNVKTKSCYAISSYKKDEKGNRTTVKLHRLLLNAGKGFKVDHIFHDTLDNRDGKIRIVTNSQNMQNRKGARIDSPTGIRGISWDKFGKRWLAQFKINGKFVFHKYFKDIAIAESELIKVRNGFLSRI